MSDDDANSGRSLRQRISKTQPTLQKRRRSCKLEISEEESLEDIYCQVNAKTIFNPTPLETIYESPKGKSQALKDCMGMVKLKRHFQFTPFYNPSKFKIKMRKNKVKKLKRIAGNLNKSVTISLEQVEKVLKEISEDENEENQIPCHFPKKIENKECENHKESLTYESDFQNFDAYDSAMEAKEDKLTSLHLNLESTSDEKKFKFLELDWQSPEKQKSDKSKRERRRSRRVLPMCLNDSSVDIKSLNEHSELRASADLDTKNQKSIEQVKLSESFDPVVQVKPPSFSSIAALCDSSKSSSKNSIRIRGRKKADKSRRNSGTNRSLYKSYVDFSLNDTIGNVEESRSFKTDDMVIKNTRPPTSLMDQLRIGSPEPPHCNQFATKKGRRKSARLSIGKVEDSCFGSVWIGTESPIYGKTQEVDKSSTIKSITTEINKATESEVSSDYKDTLATGSFDNHSLDKVNVNSPILSGIFHCQARLSKDMTLKRKRGSSVSLKHFSFNS